MMRFSRFTLCALQISSSKPRVKQMFFENDCLGLFRFVTTKGKKRSEKLKFARLQLPAAKRHHDGQDLLERVAYSIRYIHKMKE